VEKRLVAGDERTGLCVGGLPSDDGDKPGDGHISCAEGADLIR
jgi:hypothetical protein